MTGMTGPGKRSTAKVGMEPKSAALGADTLPPRQPGGGLDTCEPNNSII